MQVLTRMGRFLRNFEGSTGMQFFMKKRVFKNPTCWIDESSSQHPWRYVKPYKSLPDIEECKDNTDDCHVDALCENTEGSYNCTCRLGYEGDGFNCSGKDVGWFDYAISFSVAFNSIQLVQTINVNNFIFVARKMISQACFTYILCIRWHRVVL